MQSSASEILINSYQITHHEDGDSYEFVLNKDLRVMECVKVGSHSRDIIRHIQNSRVALEGLLFELNHVRVNPRLDNSQIIECLTGALKQIGVRVQHQPKQSSMVICYKPLGEISDNVRFYLNKEGKLVFLSPATRPRLVYSKP